MKSKPARSPSARRVRRRILRRLSTGSSSGKLGLTVKSLGMTGAPSVELGKMLLKLLLIRVVACGVRGCGIAEVKLDKHASRYIRCTENFPLMLAIESTV